MRHKIESKRFRPNFTTTRLLAHYKLWAGLTFTASVFDYSGGGFTGTLTGTDIAPAYPGFSFNGTDDFIDIGSGPSAIRTILLWVNPDDVAGTDSPIDLNGSDFLTIETGTLTKNGFATGTEILYVDGIAAATTVTANWHFIGITSTNGRSATDFDIGKETANFFAGQIGEVILFDTVKTPPEIMSIYNLTRWRYV